MVDLTMKKLNKLNHNKRTNELKVRVCIGLDFIINYGKAILMISRGDK